MGRRVRLARWALLGLALGGLGACTGQAGPAPNVASSRPGLDQAAFETWAATAIGPRVPSAVLAVVEDSRLRLELGVGSLDARGGPPPEPERAVYRFGSITKVLTGVALLRLQDEGRLDFDDPVTRFVPELGPQYDGVTIRHLTTHTSGIPSTGDGSAVYWKDTPPSEEQLLVALSGPLVFPPGSSSSYSNAGMALAGVVVARAAAEPFRSYLERAVLEPLGIRDAAWARSEVPEELLATGVAPDGSVDPPHWELGAFEAAGGLYGSMPDLARLARLTFGRFPAVLSPSSLSQALADDELPGKHGVAWGVSERSGYQAVSHTGSTSDYCASIVVLPERRLAAIVLMSGGDSELASCSAKTLVHAAATGQRLDPCVTPLLDARELARYDAALTRLRALLMTTELSDAALEGLLAPSFLAAVPKATIAAVVRDIQQRYGACQKHAIVDAGGLGVRAELSCADERLEVELHVDKASELIDGLLFPGL